MGDCPRNMQVCDIDMLKPVIIFRYTYMNTRICIMNILINQNLFVIDAFEQTGSDAFLPVSTPAC